MSRNPRAEGSDTAATPARDAPRPEGLSPTPPRHVVRKAGLLAGRFFPHCIIPEQEKRPRRGWGKPKRESLRSVGGPWEAARISIRSPQENPAPRARFRRWWDASLRSVPPIAGAESNPRGKTRPRPGRTGTGTRNSRVRPVPPGSRSARMPPCRAPSNRRPPSIPTERKRPGA